MGTTGETRTGRKVQNVMNKRRGLKHLWKQVPPLQIIF